MKEVIQKTKLAIYLKADELAKEQNLTTGNKREFYITLRQLQHILDQSCPCDCGYQEPYGFVPEADCPIHDN